MDIKMFIKSDVNGCDFCEEKKKVIILCSKIFLTVLFYNQSKSGSV